MLQEFEVSKDVSSIIYIDANTLYDGIKLQYPLPLKDFELVEDFSDCCIQMETLSFASWKPEKLQTAVLCP